MPGQHHPDSFYIPPDQVSAVVVSGDYAYIAANSAGLRIVDISDPANPMEVGIYSTENWTIGLAVGGDYAYLADGGFRVVDVSDPANPVDVYHNPYSNARDVAVAGDYAHILEGYVIQIVDVSNPFAPIEKGAYYTQDLTYDVAIAGEYAYLAARSIGLRVVDVSNPDHPFEVGYYITSGFAGGVTVFGDYIYLADGGLFVFKLCCKLMVSNNGTGTGLVISNPAGITCEPDCEERYNQNTEVTLSVMAWPASTFDGWSGDCTGTGNCVVTMDAWKHVVATFTSTGEELSSTFLPILIKP